jgi:hypothetical protein
MLKEIFGSQIGSSPYDDEIALACPLGKHLAHGFVGRQSHLSDTADLGESGAPISVFVLALECDTEPRHFLGPVLAPMTGDIDTPQARAAIQKYDDTGLECGEGHTLLHPFDFAHFDKI